ncbi:MAG TPA: L,D-transpeptidase family protein [Pyrinomonadaceae bacterium]|nr:L,D-transpeptidase family protein [Pyrinomonadaceae bacterium]
MRGWSIALILFFTATVVSAQIKKPSPPAVKVPFTESKQAVVVTTPSWTATQGTARLFERRSSRSRWMQKGDSFPIVVGRTGLAWDIGSAPEAASEFKKEGDGKSPAGLMPLTSSFGSGETMGRLTYTKLTESTECVDDVNSSFYNRIVNRMQVGNFDWKSSEKMLAVGPEYELGIFVAYNSYPVRKGDGSCIFLHVWKHAESATSGCTAMEKANLERVLAWADPKKNPYLVQLTEGEYKTRQKQWNLPALN